MGMLLVDAKEIDRLRSNPLVLVVDLRERENYKQGHVEGAINIPYDTFDEQDALFQAYEMILLYCARGNQSLLAARKLIANGHQAGSVSGGYFAINNRNRYGGKR